MQETVKYNLHDDPTYQQLLANQAVNRQVQLEKFEAVGRLTNWRENMKNNTNREKILAGRSKILSLVMRACLKAGQSVENTPSPQ